MSKSSDKWLVLGLYLLITLLFFHHSLPFFNTHLIGPPEDNMNALWNLWWVQKIFYGDFTLAEKWAKLTFTNHLFYPEGSSLYFQTYSFFNMALSLPLSFFLSLPAIYNLEILLTFVLSGLGAFCLIHTLTQNRLASFVGGFIFAFNPSHLAHSLHHLNISSIQFLPLFILFFIKSARHSSKKDLFLAGLFFLLNALCSWTYFIFGSLFLALSYFYLIFRRKKILLPDIAWKIFVIVGSTLILLSPWLAGMVLTGLEHPEIHREGHEIFVADLLGFFLPHQGHLLGFLEPLQRINRQYTGLPWESVVYLGLVNISLIFLGLKRIWSSGAKYFYGLSLFLFFSMGSSPHIMGKIIPIGLPYTVIEHIPLLQMARVPSRWIVLAYLFLAILVAHVIKSIRFSLGVLIFLLIFLDYFSLAATRFKTFVRAPACYASIPKEDKTRFGLLDIPTRMYNDNEFYMMYQTKHEMPIAGGLIARKIGPSLIESLKPLSPEQKDQLIQNKIRYIVIHKHFGPSEKVEKVVSQYDQFYDSICRDQETIIYKVY